MRCDLSQPVGDLSWPTSPKFIDLTGHRYGRLKVWCYAGRAASGQARWGCQCDCGKLTFPAGSALRAGLTLSCGCLQSERAKENATHGMTDSPEYGTWSNMKSRCFNDQTAGWELYGGRGITVCDRWRDSFPAFFADMGAKPSPNHSIDRIDVNGNYEPGNCRWATSKQQSANRRKPMSRNKELGLKAKALLPFTIFEEPQADGTNVVMVSSLNLPQHPVCLTGPNREYAEMVMLALNLLARAYS